MEKLLDILETIKPGIDYENETALIDEGLLDSLNVVALVFELNEEYGINISIADLQPENFNSLKAINELIDKLKNQES